jgi:hypothetical protein
MKSATGTAVGTGGQTLTAVGEQLQSNTNTPTSVTGSCVVTATGIGLTSALGDGTSLVTTGFQSGWGRAFNGSTGEVIGWGDNLWGTLQTSYALTGVGATTTTGDIGFVGSVAPTITSAGMSSAVGTVGTSIFVTGVSSAVSIGTYSITADATITVVASSEPELDVSLGTPIIAISPSVLPAGNPMTASLGTETVSGSCVVTATGVGTTSAIGAATISGAGNVTATGNALTASEGDITFIGSVSIVPTGQAATSAIGQATQESSYAFTGVQATSSLGNPLITASSTLTLTGVQATISTGNIGITSWNVVDDSNSAISWVEVTKAA